MAGRKGQQRSAKRKHPFSRSKPQDDLKWHVKRNTLNKAIYDHKERKCITCKKKLELYADCGGANPRLAFHLIPYGLEDDAGKSATLEIEVEISRKTRMSMHSSTKIRLSVSVQEMKEGNLLANAPINVMPHLPPPEGGGDKGGDLTTFPSNSPPLGLSS